MSFDCDINNDAHKLSNYNEKWIHEITDVVVNVSKVGVKPKTVKAVIDCMKNQRVFILYGSNSMVVFNPSGMTTKQGDTVTKYKSLHQMMMTVKLVLLTHTKIFIPDLSLPDETLAKQIQRLK